MALPDGVDFYINENRILEPLNLVVLRDSRVDLFPRIKERTEEIPGRHGEISFGSKLEPRILELHVVVSEEFPFAEREKKKREIAGYLNPTMGTKVLVFADEPDKQYFVKYAGVIDIERQYASWFEFTIPFKCSDPYIYGIVEQEKMVAFKHSPVAVNINRDIHASSVRPVINLKNQGQDVINEFTLQQYDGNFQYGWLESLSQDENYFLGDATSWDEFNWGHVFLSAYFGEPVINSGKPAKCKIQFAGVLNPGDVIKIDSKTFEVKINNNNALKYIRLDKFPIVGPGCSNFVCTNGGMLQMTVQWRDRWL